MYLINITKMIFCTLFVMSTSFIQAQSFTISGTVSTIAENPLDQVEIQAERSDGVFTTITDENGGYSIEIPLTDPNELNTTIRLKRTTIIQENVSFRDLIKVRMLILGLTDEANWETWQTVAVDMNDSGVNIGNNQFPENDLDGISTFDLVLMTRIVTNTEDPYDSSWRFFDKNRTTVNEFELNGVNDITNLNFTGVKLGNVDCQ